MIEDQKLDTKKEWCYECVNSIAKLKNNLKHKNFISFEIIKEIEIGYLFLVSCIINISGKKKLFILKKIEINSSKQENELQEEIKKIKSINNKYIININNFFIKKEGNKKIMYILIDFCKYGNLEKIIYQSNYLNSRIIWKIFIQIILGLKALYLNNIVIDKLFLHNIFLDKERNVKIGGFFNVLDFNFKGNMSSSYISPEMLDSNSNNNKYDMWCLGCILYELLYHKKPYGNEENSTVSIWSKSYEYELDFKQILLKLLCEEKKRLSFQELMNDRIFRRKVIEINLFDEIINKDDIKGKNI